MISKRLLKSIFALSIPAIITNVTTPLLALCDVAIVGHMGSAVYIAAIAVGGTMFNMLYWLCGFLRMGSSGMTAQAFGAGDMTQIHAIGRRGMILAFIIGSIFILLKAPLADVALQLIDASGPTRDMALRYFNICIWGAPAVLGTFVLTGWLLGMQDSRLPMIISIFINLLNIGVSLTLVYGLEMKIAGVAFGTLTAQWAGFIIGLTAAVKRHGLRSVDRHILLDRSEIKRFFRINTDIFLRTLCLVAVTLWFTRIGAMQGTVMLAVNTLLMQLFTIFSYMMDGIAFAGEALCGRYLGAADYDGLKRTVRALMLIGLMGAALFTSAYLLGGDTFIGLLSSDVEVTMRSREYFVWAASIPAVSFMAFVWDGVMIGLTRTRAMLGSMIAGGATFFICYALLFPRLHNHGLWIAFLSYLLVRGIFLWYAGRKI